MPLNRQKINELIARGKTKAALDLLREAAIDTAGEELTNEIARLSNRYQSTHEARLNRTISQEEADVELNNIIVALQQIAKKLDETQANAAPAASGSGTRMAPPSSLQRLLRTTQYVFSRLTKQPLQFPGVKWALVLSVLLHPRVLHFIDRRVAGLLDQEEGLFPPAGYPGYYFWAIWIGWAAVLFFTIRKILQTGAVKLGFLPADNSPIKGLRSFGFEDAEIFKELQREEDLAVCLHGLADDGYRFGILTGESGAGKTSFIRAGLHAAIQDRHCPCVVVKLTNEPPAASVAAALEEQLPAVRHLPQEGGLKRLLQQALEQQNCPEILLVLDQFEQFFTQQKTAESRRPFIDDLQDCYESLPEVKILISTRKDFLGYLFEIQNKLNYSLVARNNYFDLKKFSPLQASEIFKVIARSEGLAYDRDFIYAMCGDELASREDGLVSAVDIQILAFIIQGQQASEQAFTRAAFQRMGGIEGLLLRFLQEQLETPNRYNQDQAALKVLLAFIDLDRNVRAGELTLRKLEDKVDQSVSRLDLPPILQWLESLRLVTKTETKDKAARYELAHERLIIPLRNLAGKALSKMDQANINLDQRTNEWLANDKESRYLLKWREYRNIRRHEKLLTWGKNERHKRELLRSSGRKYRLRAGVLSTVLFLALLGWGIRQTNGYIFNYQVKNDIKRIILSALEREQAPFLDSLPVVDPILAIDIAERLNAKGTRDRAYARIVVEMSDSVRSNADYLNRAAAVAEKIENESYKYSAYSEIAAAAAQLGDTTLAINNLKQAVSAAEKIENESDKYSAYRSIAAAAGQLGDESILSLDCPGRKDREGIFQIFRLSFYSRGSRPIGR